MSHPVSNGQNGDGRLVAALRSGRGEAFEEIVRRHYPRLLRVAEQRCGTGALAEDAVQAALVRAHRYLTGSGSVDNLGAWLRRIVYNCSTDLLRKNDRGHVSLEVDLEDLVSDLDLWRDSSDATGPLLTSSSGERADDTALSLSPVRI